MGYTYATQTLTSSLHAKSSSSALQRADEELEMMNELSAFGAHNSES
ncbi:hypothetical protein CPTD_00016 [Corynebacterium pseudotuberculosis]|nr:hypothetical protein CPTD_00016 [Corynebacterium pseudotuberculosis]VTQ81133.1 Uncharacterised protein [Corynebacterium pseudotuberculosis]